jgi:hypothetical protein
MRHPAHRVILGACKRHPLTWTKKRAGSLFYNTLWTIEQCPKAISAPDLKAIEPKKNVPYHPRLLTLALTLSLATDN